LRCTCVLIVLRCGIEVALAMDDVGNKKPPRRYRGLGSAAADKQISFCQVLLKNLSGGKSFQLGE
jgi:hypothetical protein